MSDAPEAPVIDAPAPAAEAPVTDPPATDAPADPPKAPRTLEDVEAELAKTRREAAGYRTKLREAEPLVKAAQAAEEANKTEVQKATERAQAAEKREADTQTGYTRLELAVQYGIQPDDIDLIGSGTREEMDVRAKRLAALSAAASKAGPPPTDRPVEGLRPGATPDPAKAPDNSYPSSWAPSHVKDKESRSFHGQ